MTNAEVDILVAAGELDPKTADLIKTLNNAKTSTARAAKAAESKGPAKTPRALLTEVLTIEANGTTVKTPFKVLHVHNGVSGKFYRGHKLDARYLTAIRSFTGSL